MLCSYCLNFSHVEGRMNLAFLGLHLLVLGIKETSYFRDMNVKSLAASAHLSQKTFAIVAFQGINKKKEVHT